MQTSGSYAEAPWAPEEPRAVARPIELKPVYSFRFMARLGVSMLWHDKLKLAGTPSYVGRGGVFLGVPDSAKLGRIVAR